MARRTRRPSIEQAAGEALRAFRTKRGLSQEALGHEIGSGRTCISQLERGERGPSLKMLFRLSPALGTTPSEIVRRIERMLAEDER